jgi:uncharacterized protein YkwD
MRRIGVIVMCLLVAGVVGGTTAASAHYRANLAQRQELCQKPRKRCQGKQRKQRKQRSVSQKQQGASQTSREPSTVVPPLEELIAPETACPGQSDASLPVASQEATMGCMINFARSRAGDAGLAPFTALDDSSDDKAGDIIQCDEFSHTACGRPFTYWLEQDGYVQPGGCWGAGENLAWGTGELGTVRSILTAWVYSPDHLANMLTASFDHFGVGMEVGPLNGYPDAHIWVTHFGSLC